MSDEQHIQVIPDDDLTLELVKHGIDAGARAMWQSDCEADPMFSASWESSKHDYRRRTLAVAEVWIGTTP